MGLQDERLHEVARLFGAESLLLGARRTVAQARLCMCVCACSVLIHDDAGAGFLRLSVSRVESAVLDASFNPPSRILYKTHSQPNVRNHLRPCLHSLHNTFLKLQTCGGLRTT